MTDAISTQSFGRGFTSGFNTMDAYATRQDVRNRADKQDALAQARYDTEMGYRKQRDQENDRRYQDGVARQSSMLDTQERRLDEQIAQNKYVRNRQSRVDTEQKLAQRAIYETKRASQGLPVSLDFLDQIKQQNLPHLDPFFALEPQVTQDYAAAGTLLQKLQQGNINAVNEPESIALANRLFDHRIKVNLNQPDGPAGNQVGRMIVNKEIAHWNIGPNGGVTPTLRVTYSDGTSAHKPLTAGQSADPDDPVQMINANSLLDSLQGRAVWAQVLQDNGVKENMLKSLKQTQLSRGDYSSTGKTIRDLVSFGVPQEEAIALATNAKDNPEKAARDFAKSILKTQNPHSDEKLKPEQAYAKALSIVTQNNSPDAKSTQPPAPASSSNEKLEMLVQKAMQNPNNAGKEAQVRAAIAERLRGQP